MAMYYNGKKVRNLYYNGKCITRLALGKEMTRLVEGDDFVRADWLKGDGTAYIDTDIIVDVPSLYINTKFTKRENPSWSSPLFGSRNSINYEGSHIFYLIEQHLRVDVLSGIPAIDLSAINQENTLIVDVPNNKIILNGVTTNGGLNDYSGKNSVNTFRIFGLKEMSGAAVAPYEGKFSEFILNDSTHSLHLTPCRLLRPIPATLDGNGIARNAGDCGMFDAVSGKFYGNVASSGAFTVEPSLVEGVDYEVHRWLKTGSGNPYIQVDDTCNTDANAYIETAYKCNYSNGGIDMVVGFTVNQNNNIGIRIFNTANGTFVDYHKTENGVLSSYRVFKSQSSINAERYIKATLNNLIIDTTEYPSINWGSGFDSVNYPNTRLLTNSNNNDVRFKRTKIRVNFKEFDLVPVRLLRPLPSYLDANGKARKQFECGMLDLKTMKFYGNVNTIGTFTVSDY